MEDTRQNFELVHVLRHSFRPSQPLGNAIENFIKPGKILPRLLLYGSKEAAVDLQAYNDFAYKKEEDKAQADFTKNTESIYISPIMHFREIGSSAVRLAFLPTDESVPVFNRAINTLDDAIPNILPPYDKPPRFFLYIDIPTTHIVNPEEWRPRYSTLRATLANKALRTMYSVRPEGIVGQDGKRLAVASDSDDPALALPL